MAALIAASACLAQAAHATSDAASARPAVGTWTLQPIDARIHGGQFTVVRTDHEYLRGLHTHTGTNAVQYCGSGGIRVRGRHRVHLAGSGSNRQFIVGKGLSHNQSMGVTPVAVTVVFQQRDYAGLLRVKFSDATSAEGEIDFTSPVTHEKCALPFNAKSSG